MPRHDDLHACFHVESFWHGYLHLPRGVSLLIVIILSLYLSPVESSFSVSCFTAVSSEMLKTLIFISVMGLAFSLAAVDVHFEELAKGIKDGSLIYIDIRNRSELANNGKIPGSFNVPCK